jgi:hypothetical protein
VLEEIAPRCIDGTQNGISIKGGYEGFTTQELKDVLKSRGLKVVH